MNGDKANILKEAVIKV